MSILTIILIVLAGIVALPFLFALFMRKEHYVSSEIIIRAPNQKVFDFVKLLKNQEKFNKNAAADADRKQEFIGTDGAVGFIIAWSGNKNAGEGEKEIKNIIEGKRIESEIRFVKPMKTSATIVMQTESVSDHETKVSWSNKGTLPYPLNIMIPMVEKHVAKDMNSSLVTLKDILEK